MLQGPFTKKYLSREDILWENFPASGSFAVMYL